MDSLLISRAACRATNARMRTTVIALVPYIYIVISAMTTHASDSASENMPL